MRRTTLLSSLMARPATAALVLTVGAAGWFGAVSGPGGSGAVARAAGTDPKAEKASKDADPKVTKDANGNGGKPGVAELVAQLKNTEPGIRRTAAAALGKMGADAEDAEDALAAAMKVEEFDTVRKAMEDALNRIEAATAVKVKPKSKKKDSEFTYQGKQAAEWIRMLGVRNVTIADRRGVVAALSVIGPEYRDTIPTLLVLLNRDQDFTVKIAAATALGGMGKAARDAVPALSNALRSPNAELRLTAAAALGKIGRPARQAAQAVASLFKASDPDTYVPVASALAGMEAAPQTLVTQLSGMLKDRDAKFRGAAVAALKALGPEARSAVPAIVPLLDDPAAEIAAAAGATLTAIGRPAIPALLKAFADNEASTAAAAVKAGKRAAIVRHIAEIEDETHSAVPLLLSLAADRDSEDRAASIARRTLDKAGEAAAPAVREVLRSKTAPAKDQLAAADHLIHLGAEHWKDDVPAVLTAVAGVEVERTRLRLIAALAKEKGVAGLLDDCHKSDAPARRLLGLQIGARVMAVEEDKEVRAKIISRWIAALGDADMGVRTAATANLRATRPFPVDDLTTVLAVDDLTLKNGVLDLLGVVPPSILIEKMAVFVPLLGDAAEGVREKAAGLLGKGGRYSVTPLTEGLKNVDKNIRKGCAVLLGKLGPAARDAATALAVATEDADAGVAEAATTALKAITGK